VIFLQDTHVLPQLAMKNTADVTGGKPIAVLLHLILIYLSDINPLVAFTTSIYYDIHKRINMDIPIIIDISSNEYNTKTKQWMLRIRNISVYNLLWAGSTYNGS
jgi:hypothetical protein